ncbi:MAG: hypothetical protein QF491_20820 [Alphaproteobacteria bacterium]|nr:hypothetical protein [Alphaproteobacteria bacterium]
MAREQIVIDPHFVGPPEITLGSYISGRMAAYLDSDTVTVTLRAPTPMGRPVGVDTDTPGEVRMYDGDTLLNEAVPGSLDIEIPEVIGLEEAKGASLRHVIEMPFPDCFGCGSARTEDTGLHLRSGPVAGRNLVAVDWLPRAKAVGAGMGEPVPKAMIWAALECPMARALDLPDMKTPERIPPPSPTITQGRRMRTTRSEERSATSSWLLPAMRRMSSVASASITSITSSKVTRPSTRPPSSTTGTVTRLWRAIRLATSSWSSPAGHETTGRCTSSEIGVHGEAVTSRERPRRPSRRSS